MENDQKTSQATDVSALLSDLNAGVYEQQVNRMLSDIALNCVTHRRKGELTLKFVFKPIGDSDQVEVMHSIKAITPKPKGRVIEENASTTPLHVGQGGKLSLFPHSQRGLFEEHG